MIIGVFFAGLTVGYPIFTNTNVNPMSMMQNPQHMQTLLQNPEFMEKWAQTITKNPSGRDYLGEQMARSHQLMREMMKNQQFQQSMINSIMDDPQARQQIMESMTNDPEMLSKWFETTSHIKQMAKTMKENHEFMQEMMIEIIDDPSLRLQMLGHMTENQEALQQMKKLTESNDSMMEEMQMDSMQDNVDFSNIRLTNLTPTSVSIVGTTNIAVNCQVEYGIGGEFTNKASDNAMMNMNMPHETHMVLITDLTPNTNYDFRFKAIVDDQTFYSDIKSFVTPDM